MSRIGLTIRSTELRPGEVMRATHAARAYLWSPEDGLGWWFVDDCRDMPGADGVPAWPLCERPDVKGAIVAVDVPADAEALARVCRGEHEARQDRADVAFNAIERAPGRADPLSDQSPPLADWALIAALRAHPDPLGLLARAKIVGPWRSGDFGLVRCDVATWRAVATEALGSCDEEDARLLADGWRLL